MFDCVVVGGGLGGMVAACRLQEFGLIAAATVVSALAPEAIS